MSCGVVLIDKHVGISSAGIVARLKKRLNTSRIGHAGTLDPMASGLLVCLAGSATRLASFAQDGTKVYSGTIELGLTTSSDDITGEVLSRSERTPDFSDIVEAARGFVGEIQQVPPRVSALKIDGERSYQRARRGEEFEIKPRTVRVDCFDVIPGEERRFGFRVQCGKGTYIRSLARDIGEKLGCGGCLASLRREATAPFSVQNALPVDEAGAADVLPWDILFPEALKLTVADSDAAKLVNGEKRMLGLVSERAGSSARTQAIYYRENSSTPLGLLKRLESGDWDYALNIPT